MFIAVVCAVRGKSGLKRAAVFVVLGSVAQAEAESIVARIRRAMRALTIAGGRFCFTYASNSL